MVRTQIYLTEEEKDGLEAVAKSTDKKQSEIIREAVDRFLDLTKGNRRKAILDEAAGMWKNREDLPDFKAARRSWDRG
ncbi:MAG: CopG family transcriptional regulator [Lentisphaerae bacterium]|nr:CopG family transcriptional regulator [Lentisphaerota bacterium]